MEGMVDHAQPVLDRVGELPQRSASGRCGSIGRVRDWAAKETLLFPVVALFFIGVAGNLPSELFQDGWLVILGGRELVHHGLPSHYNLTLRTHGREWLDQQRPAQRRFY